MALRYLEAHRVEWPASAPQFVEPGYCLWCNQPLSGKAKKFCSLKVFPREKYQYWTASPCAIDFGHYFYSRPAYQRAIMIRDNFTCLKCGLHPMREDKPWLPDLSKLHVDHIIPISVVGVTEMKNLQTLCAKCNLTKADKVLGKEQGIPSYKLRGNGYPPGKCPECKNGPYMLLSWEPPEGLDPRLRKVSCNRCELAYYLAPLIKKGAKG